MIYAANGRTGGGSDGAVAEEGEGELNEMARLRLENRRLAVSLGAFSAFVASKGMLEAAWQYVHEVHKLDEGAR